MTDLARRVAERLFDSDDWYREAAIETRTDGEFKFCVEHDTEKAAAIAVAAFKGWLKEQEAGVAEQTEAKAAESDHGVCIGPKRAAGIAIAALVSAIEEGE